MKIVKFKQEYEEDVKQLLVDLQEYLISLDKYKLQRITPEYREKYFADFMNKINTKNGICYVAKQGDKVVGFIGGVIEYIDNEIDKICLNFRKFGKVIELCIGSKFRGLGAGTLLLNKMEKYFIERGCDFSYIDVFGANEKALNFYGKNDYENRCIMMMKKIEGR